MRPADELANSAAERAALAALREAARHADSPMERHALRVFLIAHRMASERNLQFDSEVALCASLLHDVGIFRAASRGVHYLKDGRAFARDVLSPSLEGPRLVRCLDAVERHHHVRSQWKQGVEVELLRRADVIDGFPLLVRTQLDRRWLRDLFGRISRRGIYRQFLFPPLRFVRVLPFGVLSLVNALAFAFRPA